MTDIDWRVLKSNADAERAQLNRILADIRDTINTSAESTLLQANATSTLTTEQGLSGMATAWRDTNARVTRNGNNITALAEDITFLSARVDDLDEDMYGEAGALQLLSARVDSNEDGITANANSLLKLGALTPDGSAFLLDSGTVLVSPSQSLAQWRTELNTSLDDKANSSTVTELSNTVSQQGDTITAHGTQLSSLSASVGDAEASINELREVSVAARLIDVRNADFESGETGWSQHTSGAGPLPDGVYVTTHPSVASHSGVLSLRFDVVGAGSSSVNVFNEGRTKVTPGEQLRVGIWASRIGTLPNPEATASFGARGYDLEGNYISGTAVGWSTEPIRSTTGWFFYSNVYTVSEGVDTIGVYVGTRNHTEGSIRIDDVVLERISHDMAEVRSRYSLAVTAGGDVAGMELLAGGGTSAIRFLTNSFEIVAPSGGARTTYSGGTWSVYDSSNKLRMRWGVW